MRRLADNPLIAEHRRVGPAVFAFTSRHGGISRPPYESLNLGLHVGDADSAVFENRDRVCAALRAQNRTWAEAEQVHGSRVARVTQDAVWLSADGLALAASELRYAKTDALFTCYSDYLLALFFADCVPVFMVEPTSRLVGLAHAGWRGTALRIATETLFFVGGPGTPLGGRPERTRVVIGPCVGLCCYEVGWRVMRAVLATIPRSLHDERVVRRTGFGRWHINLARINALQLMEAGVPEDHIEVIPRCTRCEGGTFFSARGDGRVTGRCGAFAWLE